MVFKNTKRQDFSCLYSLKIYTEISTKSFNAR